MTLDNIIEEIQRAKDVVILTHDLPDGDAIGSSLALYNGLKQIGKQVDIIIPGYPPKYSFLSGTNEIKNEGKQENYDLAIALDCGNVSRLNGFSKYFENANSRISIDHHEANTMFADYNYVDPISPATAQTLIVILESLGIEITKEIGTCLLVGIITDTGGFKYEGISPETFEFVARLLSRGINVSYVYKKCLQMVSRERFELTKIAMDRLEFFEQR